MKRFAAVTVLLCIFFSGAAFAGEDAITAPDVQKNADFLWTLVAAFMVFFMQAGFAMVESGFTRAKNAVNIIMKNLMDFSIGSLGYWMLGFGLMFGFTTTGWFGTSGFFLSDYTRTEDP